MFFPRAEPFGFHAIRHLTASILFAAGEPLWKIQGILRHKNPTTTERYLRTLGLESARDAMENNLRDRLKSSHFPKAKRPQRWHSEGVLYPDFVSGLR
jgi:integrase